MISHRNLILSALVAMCLAFTGGPAVASVRAASSSTNYAPLTKAEIREITSVSLTTLTAVGAGDRHGSRTSPPGLVHAARLSEHGKPELAYILGEFCPYCAGENWSVAVALSRFGTLTGMTTLTSSAQDDPPSIRTVSFRYSHYRSRFLVFDPIVNEDVNMKPVDPVPSKIRRLWRRYSDGYPFMDFGGKAALNLSSFDPSYLVKLSRQRIAEDLNRPKQRVANAIDGTENQLTAAICVMTDNKPARICKTKTIAKIRRSLRPLRAD